MWTYKHWKCYLYISPEKIWSLFRGKDTRKKRRKRRRRTRKNCRAKLLMTMSQFGVWVVFVVQHFQDEHQMSFSFQLSSAQRTHTRIRRDKLNAFIKRFFCCCCCCWWKYVIRSRPSHESFIFSFWMFIILTYASGHEFQMNAFALVINGLIRMNYVQQQNTNNKKMYRIDGSMEFQNRIKFI